MHSRLSRSARIALVLATMASLLAVPFPVLGAKGSDLEADVVALIDEVSPGMRTAFTASLANTGSSTITHLRFTGTATAGGLASGPGACTGAIGATTVECTLGTLPAGQVVTMTFVFDAPASGEMTFTGVFSGDAHQANNQAAKDDTWSGNATVRINSSGDFFGTWQSPHDGVLTFSTAGVGGANHQSTSVVVPPVAVDYKAVVSETDSSIACEGGATIGGFGQAVNLAIADGDPVQPFIELVMSYDSVSASGRSPGQVSVVHQLDDGTCEFPVKDCKRNAAPCYDAFWSGGGANKQLVIRVELLTNGVAKGV